MEQKAAQESGKGVFVTWPMSCLCSRLLPSRFPHIHLMRSEFLNPSRCHPCWLQTVPAPWEWPGDTETLSMNMTHRTWYIEVSQFHTKVITNATLWDLEQVLATQQLANTPAPIHPLSSVRPSFPSHHIPSLLCIQSRDRLAS